MSVDDLCKRLEGWANQLAGRFGHPVYLVGSALEQGEEARDVDVVVILPKEEFWGRYGTGSGHESVDPDWSEGSLQWARDMGKLASYAARTLQLNIDLKAQPDILVTVRQHGRPRRRLDKTSLPEVFVPPKFGCECHWCQDARMRPMPTEPPTCGQETDR